MKRPERVIYRRERKKRGWEAGTVIWGRHRGEDLEKETEEDSKEEKVSKGHLCLALPFFAKLSPSSTWSKEDCPH